MTTPDTIDGDLAKEILTRLRDALGCGSIGEVEAAVMEMIHPTRMDAWPTKLMNGAWRYVTGPRSHFDGTWKLCDSGLEFVSTFAGIVAMWYENDFEPGEHFERLPTPVPLSPLDPPSRPADP